jgi:hypothetical protein
MSEPHVGDVGTVFQVQVRDGVLPADLSGAICLSMMFVSAKGRRFIVPALLATDGQDGLVRYTTMVGDLDAPGLWHLQVLVSMPLGSWCSGETSFSVLPNL